MGSRGRGALLTREAREEALQSTRRMPWKRKGLNPPERVKAFLEFLPITAGKLVGRKMRLLDEQKAFVDRVYGDLDRRGERHIRVAIKSEAKGNGKTGMLAGLALCHLLGPEAEQRGEVYSAAIDRQQAGIMFNEMEAIILAVPEFASRVNVQRFHKRIEVLDGDGVGSIYEALSADARRAHGLKPSLFVYDELAQARDRVLLDNLVNGLGKRPNALGIIISTQAEDDEHALSQLIDDGLTGVDPSTFVQLLCAAEDDDPFAESTWKSCNPALGKFLSLKEIRDAAARAQRIPAFEASFRNLRLNQRIDSNTENRVVTRDVWEKCRGEHVPVDIDALAGRECFGFLDLSGKHDLTSLTLVFPDDQKEPSYDIAPFFWTPDGAMATRRPAEQSLFRQWINQGFIESVPGPVIRYGYVARKLIDITRQFDLKACGYDRWRIDDLKQELAALGVEGEIPLEAYGQGFKDMSPAIEWMVEVALTGRLRHGGHPVLTASVANAIVVSDEAGNQKFDKARGNRRGSVRIDGAVTLAGALAIAKRFVEEAPVADVSDFLSNAVMA